MHNTGNVWYGRNPMHTIKYDSKLIMPQFLERRVHVLVSRVINMRMSINFLILSLMIVQNHGLISTIVKNTAMARRSSSLYFSISGTPRQIICRSDARSIIRNRIVPVRMAVLGVGGLHSFYSSFFPSTLSYKKKHVHLSTSSLWMGYLDDLSSRASPSEEGGQSKNNSNDPSKNKSPFNYSSWNGPIQNSPKGVIPSGRGPLGSYLDSVSSKSSNSFDGTQNDDNGIQSDNYLDHEDNYYGSNKDKNANGNNTNQGQDIQISVFDSSKRKSESWSNSYLTKFLSTEKDDERTDIRNLLTQRSIQSFMRLLEECRDPHSAKCKI